MCGRVEGNGVPFNANLGSRNGVVGGMYQFMQVPGRPEWATLPTSKICDFDNGMCGFTPEGGADDKKMWRRSTTTKDRSSGPEKAYTGRYFLYLDTSSGKQKQGDASYLVSKKLEHIHYIHFYYHRFASTAAQLGEFAVEAKMNMYVGPFVGALGAGRYSVPPQNIKFQAVKVKASSGSFSPYMVAECKKIGMKPLCEHPSYCRTDKKALYMGQYYHLPHKPYRNINSWFPSGWSKIRPFFEDGLCFYSGNNRGNALCNIPTNSHAWKYPKDVSGSSSIMCGVVTKDKAAPPLTKRVWTSIWLRGKGHRTQSSKTAGWSSVGVTLPTGTTQIRFKGVRGSGAQGITAIDKITWYGAYYSTIMVNECGKYDMKPVCSYKNYCRNDKNSLYVGQDDR